MIKPLFNLSNFPSFHYLMAQGCTIPIAINLSGERKKPAFFLKRKPCLCSFLKGRQTNYKSLLVTVGSDVKGAN